MEILFEGNRLPHGICQKYNDNRTVVIWCVLNGWSSSFYCIETAIRTTLAYKPREFSVSLQQTTIFSAFESLIFHYKFYMFWRALFSMFSMLFSIAQNLLKCISHFDVNAFFPNCRKDVRYLQYDLYYRMVSYSNLSSNLGEDIYFGILLKIAQ